MCLSFLAQVQKRRKRGGTFLKCVNLKSVACILVRDKNVKGGVLLKESLLLTTKNFPSGPPGSLVQITLHPLSDKVTYIL